MALIVIYFGIQKDEEKGIATSDVEFAVEDIASVNRVMMQNRSGDKVELSKKADGQWMVNEDYPAFLPYVEIFLDKTLSKIKVKGPVAKAARDNVIRHMISSAIRVDVYQNSKKVKTYYIGEHTPDMKGTYMHIEGSNTPYIAYIPGLNGYITPNYSLDAKEWYDHSIFDYSVDSIAQIEMRHYTEAEASFKLKKNGDVYSIEPASGGLSIQAAKSYFALFHFKNFEGYADYLSEEAKDSIKHSAPIMELIVTDINGTEKHLKVFVKGSQSKEGLVDDKGNVLAYDPERYFATFTGMPHLVTIQDYTFGNLLVKRKDFRP